MNSFERDNAVRRLRAVIEAELLLEDGRHDPTQEQEERAVTSILDSLGYGRRTPTANEVKAYIEGIENWLNDASALVARGAHILRDPISLHCQELQAAGYASEVAVQVDIDTARGTADLQFILQLTAQEVQLPISISVRSGSGWTKPVAVSLFGTARVTEVKIPMKGTQLELRFLGI